jgi:hypothetical protein
MATIRGSQTGVRIHASSHCPLLILLYSGFVRPILWFRTLIAPISMAVPALHKGMNSKTGIEPANAAF